MTTERMLTMANQIADFFRSFPHEEAVAGVAQHVRQFWDPRMRRKLLEHLDAGGEGFDPLVREAAARLRQPA
ncbi:formate dehydrogenase subunit delta [Alsobacter sp. SYSU M60028]|uniref:Formate dehydrogenase subunit delta n=1 Tax=Alsobacter ponti TaxID=2962936 RepID=A0ABT1LA93_9HYPH|nr:formate dehydrogenase subunit delta [Alsobacter ponti]MCP8937670.1 formate dehydrogenase subunit delta [Alsobacter ponti]